MNLPLSLNCRRLEPGDDVIGIDLLAQVVFVSVIGKRITSGSAYHSRTPPALSYTAARPIATSRLWVSRAATARRPTPS